MSGSCYCRRCFIHDDPGGCLEQEDRQNLLDLVTPDEEWPAGWHYTDDFDPDILESPEQLDEPMSSLYLIEI